MQQGNVSSNPQGPEAAGGRQQKIEGDGHGQNGAAGRPIARPDPETEKEQEEGIGRPDAPPGRLRWWRAPKHPELRKQSADGQKAEAVTTVKIAEGQLPQGKFDLGQQTKERPG